MVIAASHLLPRATELLSSEASSRGGSVAPLGPHVAGDPLARGAGPRLEADLVICERLVSHRYSSGTSSPGVLPSAAALANSSAISLPGISLCAETQRMVTSLSRLRIREQTSIDGMAKRWLGPEVSDPTLSMAAVESTKDSIPVAALLSLIEGAQNLVDGERLRVEDLFIGAQAEAPVGPS